MKKKNNYITKKLQEYIDSNETYQKYRNSEYSVLDENDRKIIEHCSDIEDLIREYESSETYTDFLQKNNQNLEKKLKSICKNKKDKKTYDKNVAHGISNYNKEYKHAINKVAQYFPLSSEEVEAILNGEVSYKMMNEISLSQSSTEFKDSVCAFRFAVMQQQIDEKDKKIKELEETLEKANKQLDLDYVDKNYIPTQKVKDKIEDLKRKRRDLGFKTYFKREDMLNEDRAIMCEISVLQELLEGVE